jgi:parvulin-like peptidyl-prolyl isomerase
VTKKILAVLVVVILAGTVSLLAGCGGNLPKDAVAKVGSVIITQKAFDARTADFEAQYAGQIPDKATDPASYKAFQHDVLEYMITYQLASQAAQDLKLTITDADVQKEIDSILASTFAGDQTKFDAALVQQGITLDQLKASYKESMLLQKVYDEITKGVTTVPDTDVQAYYDAHKTDYFVAETRTARHILLTPVAGRVDATTTTTSTSTTSTTSTTVPSTTGSSDASSTASTDTATATSGSTTTTAAPTQADWDAALAAAKLVRAQLVAGADWTIEAKMYSDDPGSNQVGGDLGTISKGQMVQEFEDAVFSQKKDEISEPVKSAYGYHIIQVTSITEAKQYTLDEVKEEIKTTLLSDAKSKAWQAWVDAQKVKIGVVYATDWVTTTTTAASTATTAATTATTAGTTGTDDTATTAAPSSDTTVAPSTTTTAGATLTTAAPTATTAAPTATTAGTTVTTAAP